MKPHGSAWRAGPGLSLLELVVAMSLLFLVQAMLLHLFVSAGRYGQRANERSVASFLAQSTLESVMARMTPLVPVGQGRYADARAAYVYDVALADYDRQMQWLSVTVTAPGGVRASVGILRPRWPGLYHPDPTIAALPGTIVPIKGGLER